MLYICCLIILNGQNIGENFLKFPILSCRGWETAYAVCTSGATELPTNSNIGGFRGPMALANGAY